MQRTKTHDNMTLGWLRIAYCDAAEPWQVGFQDAATPMMQGIIDLHHDILSFLVMIILFVLWMLVRALWHFHYKRHTIPERVVHGTLIEIIWRASVRSPIEPARQILPRTP